MSDKPERLEWWRNYEYVSDPSLTSPTTDAFGNPYKFVFNADNVPNIPIDFTGNWHSPESAYELFLKYSSLLTVWVNDTRDKTLPAEEPVTMFGVPIVHTNFIPPLDPDTPILRILPLSVSVSVKLTKKSREEGDETP